MKPIISIIFFFVYVNSYATHYYVSASGNDANNGTSTSTPFLTISKVNSLSLVAGDIVSFNGGDTFYGALSITHSGSSGNPITYNSYGTGNAIVTGFTNVTAWTNLGSNIWESTSAVSALSTCNMVVISGVNTLMGRTPNTGYYTYQTWNGSTQITSSNLNSSVINYTGAQAVIRKNNYVTDRCTITSQSGTTITFTDPAGNFNSTNNYGFFIQNDSRTLDIQNEWYYNPSTKKIRIYSTSSPTNVQVSTIDNLISTGSSTFIIIDGLDIIGANNDGILFNGSNTTIKNCNITFSGTDCIESTGGNNSLLDNNSISSSGKAGIFYNSANTGSIITNNKVFYSGVIEGQADNGSQANGIFSANLSAIIQYNVIKGTGSHGIFSKGDNTLIQYNFLDSLVLTTTDQGGIYTHKNTTIDHNIVLNPIGNIIGAVGSNIPEGIYLDDDVTFSNHNQVTNNTVAHSNNAGIKVHQNSDNYIRGNTFYDNATWQVYYQDNAGMARDTLRSNILFSKYATQYCYGYVNSNNNIDAVGVQDSNYFARPINDSLTANLVFQLYQQNSNYFIQSLAMWQNFTATQGIPFDVHSKKSPVNISNINQLFFAYDSSKTSSVINIPSGTWVDVTGTPYNTGTVTLQPYTSIVLISTGSNIPPIANAGTNVNITLPTNSFTQVGSGTDADGTIVAYAWTQISGANTATIGSPNSATTLISNLIAGNYVFQLKVTDNGGATGIDTMSAVVNSAVVNQPPTVNAGGNKIITLPVSTVTQDGSATPGTGTIVSYAWTQSNTNPITATIVSPTNPVTVINNLGVSGVYLFTLSCTDNLGSVGSQTITVTVNAPIATPPTANAGLDQTITWPANSVTLSGSGTAGSGTIVSYNWVQLSDFVATITNPNSQNTTVTGMDIGTYLFQLTVTNNSGLQGKDTMQVTVNKGSASLSFSVPTLMQTWTGLPLAPTIITSPAGLSTSILYNGIGATPIEPNTYNLIANITDLSHWNSTAITGTFIINKVTVTFIITNTSQYFNNTPLTPFVTTNPSNLTGVSIASPHTASGIYSDTITLNNPHYQATQVITPFTITTAGATIIITGYQNIFYTGNTISVIAVTNPLGISNVITYNGSTSSPTNTGTYQVIATINDGIHSGADTVTMVIQKANPVITYPAQSAIVQGTALTSANLNATSNVAGTFTYNYSVGQVLAPGTYLLTATFHPTSTNYNSNTASTTISIFGTALLNFYIIPSNTIYLNL